MQRLNTRSTRVSASLISAVIVSSVLYAVSPYLTDKSAVLKLKIEDISDILFSASIIIHIAWIIMISALKGKQGNIAQRLPDFFIVSTLMFFLFNYLFAANAGLEYVQRFAKTSDVLSFAPDTGTERLITALLFTPLLAADIFASLVFRREKLLSINSMRLPLTLLSALLYAFSFPSFLHLEGFGILIFIAFIPLLIVFKISSVRRAVFYGIAFGIFQTMIINYWLATFSLVSLQFVTILYTLLFTFFMSFSVYIYRKSKIGWLLFPFAWIVFEWARSSGFSAYPWCLTGSAIYKYLPLIQIASVTGIWGISFMVVLINTSLAELLYTTLASGSENNTAQPAAKKSFTLLTEGSSSLYDEGQAEKRGRKEKLFCKPCSSLKKYIPVITALTVTSAVLIFGFYELERDSRLKADRNVSLSLIQQNADPRKTGYGESFESLKKLTDEARSLEKTDLVVWSETAFVPNIRRWGSLEREYNSLTRITHKFLDYQREGNFYLVTGNDDYEIIENSDGSVVRNEYNAAVFFSDKGKRLDTYRKIRLVPFTEYFPFKKQLPWMYEILIKMDVYLWEPGKVRTVFRHPEFSFSTPICFEDLFPGYVRGFVINGADMIINISNDYWSLTETEGMQHFVNSLFRAVENRRHVARGTASGLTGVIDRTGKILETVPFYSREYMNIDIPISNENNRSLSFYTRHGDWFPFLSLLVFITAFFMTAIMDILRKKTGR